MVEKSFTGQFYHFGNHFEPIFVHYCQFGVEIFPEKFECCTKGTRGKIQIAQKNVAHWVRPVYLILTYPHSSLYRCGENSHVY